MTKNTNEVIIDGLKITFDEYLEHKGFNKEYLSTLKIKQIRKIRKNQLALYRRHRCLEIKKLRDKGYNWMQICKIIGIKKQALQEYYNRWVDKGFLGETVKKENKNRKNYQGLLEENQCLKQENEKYKKCLEDTKTMVEGMNACICGNEEANEYPKIIIKLSKGYIVDILQKIEEALNETNENTNDNR